MTTPVELGETIQRLLSTKQSARPLFADNHQEHLR